jgi:hypothetical protein
MKTTMELVDDMWQAYVLELRKGMKTGFGTLEFDFKVGCYHTLNNEFNPVFKITLGTDNLLAYTDGIILGCRTILENSKPFLNEKIIENIRKESYLRWIVYIISEEFLLNYYPSDNIEFYTIGVNLATSDGILSRDLYEQIDSTSKLYYFVDGLGFASGFLFSNYINYLSRVN